MVIEGKFFGYTCRMSAIDTLLSYDAEERKGWEPMAIYDPFGQGYMHDWRLEEVVKEGARRALRGREPGPSGNEAVLRALKALAFRMEMVREDAEVREALQRMARNPGRYYEGW